MVIDIHFRDDPEGDGTPAAVAHSLWTVLLTIAGWVKGDSDASIDEIVDQLVVSTDETTVTMPSSEGYEEVVWLLSHKEGTRGDFLLGLAERLRHVPAKYGIDGGDIHRLQQLGTTVKKIVTTFDEAKDLGQGKGASTADLNIIAERRAATKEWRNG